MNEVKISTRLNTCPKCKIQQNTDQFFRIISREDYSPDCDDDHIKLLAKPTLSCSTCRHKANEKAKKLKNKKS